MNTAQRTPIIPILHIRGKATPGPWRTGDRYETVFGPSDDQPCPPVIATVHCPDAKRSTLRANAELIAAAPSLLDALKQTENDLADLSGLLPDKHAVVLNGIRGRIEQAIAKATPNTQPAASNAVNRP